MESNFYEDIYTKLTPSKKAKITDFLAKNGLDLDPDLQLTACIYDYNDEIAATCSLSGNVLKCIAVSGDYQGMGLSSQIISTVVDYAYNKGIPHLFLFTKPENVKMFADVAFYPITKTKDVLLMENSKNGITNYVKSLEKGSEKGENGAIVMNCNPFTLGHRYLIETAAAQCENLHIFVLSEDKSEFPAEVRYNLVKEGTKDLTNVLVHKTSDYLISSAVFPTYFIKDKAKASDANCDLDLKIFCEYFAKELNITTRFVGNEPFCQVTNSYNKKMQEILPAYGIKVVEIPRKTSQDNIEISASRVRALLHQGDLDAIKKLVPATTYQYLLKEGQSYKK